MLAFMRPAARIALPLLLGAFACYSAEGDGGDDGGSSGSGGSTSTAGKASGGKTSGGASSGGSTSSGGSSSGGASTGGSSTEGGATAGGGGGIPECEQVACLRPYECVLECGGEVLYTGCCPCEAPTFDSFVECASGGGGSR